VSAAVLEELEGVLAGAGDADEVLRAIVDLLAREPNLAWAGIFLRERGALALGPRAGTPDEARRIRKPIVYRGETVGELAVDGDADHEVLDRVAAAIAPYTLLGWDTDGKAWEP
jgi:hypothetical protein